MSNEINSIIMFIWYTFYGQFEYINYFLKCMLLGECYSKLEIDFVHLGLTMNLNVFVITGVIWDWLILVGISWSFQIKQKDSKDLLDDILCNK